MENCSGVKWPFWSRINFHACFQTSVTSGWTWKWPQFGLRLSLEGGKCPPSGQKHVWIKKKGDIWTFLFFPVERRKSILITDRWCSFHSAGARLHLKQKWSLAPDVLAVLFISGPGIRSELPILCSASPGLRSKTRRRWASPISSPIWSPCSLEVPWWRCPATSSPPSSTASLCSPARSDAVPLWRRWWVIKIFQLGLCWL